MTLRYNREGISFDLPTGWEVVEDESEGAIRAVSIDAPEDSNCFLNIYRTPYAKSLRESFLCEARHFLAELPFWIRLTGDIIEEDDCVSIHGSHTSGIRATNDFRSFFFSKFRVIESYFKYEKEVYTSVCRLSCDEEHYEAQRKLFAHFLNSYQTD